MNNYTLPEYNVGKSPGRDGGCDSFMQSSFSNLRNKWYPYARFGRTWLFYGPVDSRDVTELKKKESSVEQSVRFHQTT